jgi:predicted homoserine dehydrogenase-like protein
VFSYAKVDLKKGQELDGIGGYAAYGLIENIDETYTDPGVPICIAENMTLKRDLAKDERISWNDIEYDPADYAIDLYLKTLEVDKAIQGG